MKTKIKYAGKLTAKTLEDLNRNLNRRKKMKKERISIPPNNEKLWRYMTEGLSGRAKADTLPSYPERIKRLGT
tara:strand:- start:1732 stop:1950 length:219 start_codon:yes stop_codon:yes gene_type:complete